MQRRAPSRLLTDAFREIKNTLSRFLSLFLLSALAVAFLAGLRSTAPDMEHTADDYYDRTHLMDVRVLSTLGLTDDDVAALAAAPGIEKAEGAWYVDATVHAAQNDYIVRLHSLSEVGVNDPELLEGRLPQADDECLVEPGLLASTGLTIGSTIFMDTAGTAYEDALRTNTYRIVGTVNSSLYLSTVRGSSTIGTGHLSAVAFLPRAAFDLEVYTEAYLLAEGAAPLICYEDAYKDKLDALLDALEPLGDQRAAHRYDQVVGEANEKLADAEREYADAKADADRELSDAAAELADARTELDDGWAEYYDGVDTLARETADAEQKIADGEAELADALKKLNDGEADYADGAAKLADARAEYEDGLAEYEDAAALLAARRMEYDAAVAEYEAGLAQYEAGLAQYEAAAAQLGPFAGQLDATKAQLDAAKAQLAAVKAQLDEAAAALADGEAELASAKAQLDEGAAELADGEAELASARTELDDGWAEYRDGLAELADARITLADETADAEQKLADALAELTDGEAKYADGLAEYEDARAEAEEKLADARAELDDARAEIDDIKECKWYILGRNTNAGYVSFQEDAERMGNLANVFPLIFFLVAALVCLTTMTRMVEEQRVQIGGMKALGYSRGAIALKYVGYGFLSSFLGGVAGLFIGCTLIPTIIFNAWKVLYTVGDLRLTFFPGISLLSVAAAVFSVTGAALAASFAALTAVPAALMRPKAPQAGKRVLLERVTFLWKRLSFTWKVTVRNLFRYKKRFIMAVVGIGGCTALLITGLGLRDSIHGFFDVQYGELTTYHAQVSLVEDATGEQLAELGEALDRQSLVVGWTTMSSQSVTAESDKRSADSYVYLCAATDREKFGQFVHLRDRLTHEPVPLDGEGAVVTEKLAEMLGVGVGDFITIVDADNSRTDLPISGIAENYIFHYVYLSHDAYVRLYGQEPPVNSIYVRYTEDTDAVSDAVSTDLIALSAVSSVSRTQTLRKQVMQGLEGVDYAVVVVVVSAAALAFVVLYNLLNINITERLRELATLKVLGFTDHETAAYIYRENIFLTLFGILLGLVMGKFLHEWLVLTVEIDMAMFNRTAKPLSYVLSALLTALFSILVNLAAQLRLRRIDMVESLKTVE